MIDPGKQGRFSQIVGGATYVSRRDEPWIILEIDLPKTSNGLDELFSLQLLVLRDDLQPQLDNRHLKLTSANLRFRTVQASLSAIVIAEDRHEINHFAIPLKFEVNCLLRDVHPSTGNMSHVRGTMVSGSLRLRDPEQDRAVFDSTELRGLLWPHKNLGVDEDTFHGLFLSGEQFQIEIEPNSGDGVAQPHQRWQFVGATRAKDDAVNGILWKMVQPVMPTAGIDFADPAKILSDRIDALERMLPGTGKPIAIERGATVSQAEILTFVERGGAHREFASPGINVVFKNGFQGVETVWKPGALYALPEGKYQLTDVDEVAYVLANGRTSVAPDPDQADLMVHWATDGAARVAKLSDTVLSQATAVSRDTRPVIWQMANFLFPQAAPDSWRDQPPSWVRYQVRPAPLTPQDNANVSERIAGLSRDFRIQATNDDEPNSWSVQGDVLRNVPEYLLNKSPARIALVVPPSLTADFVELQLFSAKLTVESPETNVYVEAINDPNFVPLERRVGLTTARFKPGRLRFESDPLHRGSVRNGTPPQLALTHPTARLKELTLTALQGNLTDRRLIKGARVLTPAMEGSRIQIAPGAGILAGEYHIDHVDLSNPNEWTATLDRAWLAAAVTNASAVVKCLVIESGPGTVTAYLPASRSLVDPVSPASGNVTGKQIISLPAFAAVVKVVEVEYDESANQTYVDLDRTLPSQLNDFADFFAEWLEVGVTDAPSIVARIAPQEWRELPRRIELTGNVPLTKDSVYQLELGPTRLALPRDPSHGLIAVELPQIEGYGPALDSVTPDKPRTALICCDAATVVGTESSSVFALHPWTEWGPSPLEWLKTGRIRLHHRNLIQEHAEFESSFEDRFPPEGPPADPATGKIPSPLLPYADFIRAVRDRYTEASGNILSTLQFLFYDQPNAPQTGTFKLVWDGHPTVAVPIASSNTVVENALRTVIQAIDAAYDVIVTGDLTATGLVVEFTGDLLGKPQPALAVEPSTGASPRVLVLTGTEIRNWLPGASHQSAAGHAIDSALSFTETAADPLPQVDMKWTDGVGEQSLKIRKPDDPLSARHWLEYEVEPKELSVGKLPALAISDPTSRPTPNQRRVVNSAAPLLFNDRSIEEAVYVSIDDDKYILVIKTPAQKAFVWRSEAPDKPILFPDTGLVTAISAVKAHDRIFIAVGRYNGSQSAFELYELAGDVLGLFNPGSAIGASPGSPNPNYDPGDGRISRISLSPLDYDSNLVDPHLFVALSYEKDGANKLFVVRRVGTVWRKEALALKNVTAKVTALATDQGPGLGTAPTTYCHVATASSDGRMDYYSIPPASPFTSPRSSSFPQEPLQEQFVELTGTVASVSNASDGQIQLTDFSYEVSSGALVELRWFDVDFRVRSGVKIGAVSGTIIPVSGGIGPNLPVPKTAITIRIARPFASLALRCRHEVENPSFDEADFVVASLSAAEFSSLDTETIPVIVENEFTTQGIPLSVGADAETIVPGNEWKIADQGKLFLLRRKLQDVEVVAIPQMLRVWGGFGSTLVQHQFMLPGPTDPQLVLRNLPAPIRSLAATNVNNIDRRSDRGTDAPTYLIAGCDDGMTRMLRCDSATGIAGDRRPVRLFDLAGPQLAVSSDVLAYLQRDDDNLPSRIVVANAAGQVRAFDTRDGRNLLSPIGIEEWPTESDIGVALAVYDNLGTVRKLEPHRVEDDRRQWCIERLHDTPQKLTVRELRSISTAGFVVAHRLVTDSTGFNAYDVTEVRFSCDSLKVNLDGSLDRQMFADAPFYCGVYGLFSNIVSADPEIELRHVNYWPRLCGIPFFATRLTKLKLERAEVPDITLPTPGGGDFKTLHSAAGGWKPEMLGGVLHLQSGKDFQPGFYEIVKYGSNTDIVVDRACASVAGAGLGKGVIEYPSEMEFEAVIVNPDEIAAGLNDSERLDVKGFVRSALARGSVVHLKVHFDKEPDHPERISVIDGKFDWLFALNRQFQLADPERGFEGRLARVLSDGVPSVAGGRLEFSVLGKPRSSQALIFGRLWDLLPVAGKDFAVKVFGTGRFLRRGAEWVQSEFSVHETHEVLTERDQTRLEVLPTPLAALSTVRTEAGWDQGLNQSVSLGVDDPVWRAEALRLISEVLDKRAAVIQRRTGLENSQRIARHTVSSSVLTFRPRQQTASPLLRYHAVGLRIAGSDNAVLVMKSDVELLARTGELQLTEPTPYAIPGYNDGDNTLVRLVWRPGDTGPITSVTPFPPVLTVHTPRNPLPAGEAIRILGSSYVVLDSDTDQFSLANTPEQTVINDLLQARLWQTASLVESAVGGSDAAPPLLHTEAHGLAETDAVTLIDREGNPAGTYGALKKDADNFWIVIPSLGNGDWTAGTGEWVKFGTSGTPSAIADAANRVPIKITSNGHGLHNGDKVTVSNVQGNTNANGVWFVGEVNVNEFELWNSPPKVDYTGFLWTQGDHIESITPAPDNLIQTKRTPHNLDDGDWVDLLRLDGAPVHPLFGTARIVIKDQLSPLNRFRVVIPRAPDTDSTPDPTQLFWRPLNLIEAVRQQGRLLPMIVQCREVHLLSPGDRVRLDGFAGTPDGDYNAFLHNADPKQFVLYRPLGGNGAGDGTGGIWKKDGTGPDNHIALATDTTPIRIFTQDDPHGLSDGDEITIQDVQVNTNANSVSRDPALKWRIMTVVGEDNQFDIYEPATSLTDFATGTWELPIANIEVRDIENVFPTTLIPGDPHSLKLGDLVRTLGTGLKDADGKIWTVVLAGDPRKFSLAARNTAAVDYRGGAIWRPVGALTQLQFTPSEHHAPPLEVTTAENHGLDSTHRISRRKRILLKNLEGNTVAPSIRLRYLNALPSAPMQFRAWMETRVLLGTPDEWERSEALNVVAAIYPDGPSTNTRYKRLYYGSILDNPGGVLQETQDQNTPITELQTASIRGNLVALTIDDQIVKCWFLEQPTAPPPSFAPLRLAGMDAGAPIFSLANVPLQDGRLLVAASTNMAPYLIHLWRVSMDGTTPRADKYAAMNPYGTDLIGPLAISLASTQSVSDRLTIEKQLTGLTTDEPNSNILKYSGADAAELAGKQIAITEGDNAIPGLYRIIGIVADRIELDRACVDKVGPLANGVGDVFVRTSIETVSLGVSRSERLSGLSTSVAGSDVLVSATPQFSAEFVGRTIHITTGTHAKVGEYKIIGFTDPQHVKLDRACDDGGGGLSVGVGDLARVDLFEFNLEQIVSLTGLKTATAGVGDKAVELTVERLGPDCVGKSLHLTAGNNATEGIYRIETFIDAQHIELDRPCHDGVVAMTNGVGVVTPAFVKTAVFDIPYNTQSFALQGSAVGIELLTRSESRIAIQTPQRVLRVSSLKERSPEFQLPVVLNQAGAKDLVTFAAEITRARQIDLRFAPKGEPQERALAQLQQGIHRCFFARPTSVREGRDGLILAPEGDINQPRLHAIHLRAMTNADAEAEVVVTGASPQLFRGPLVRIDVTAGVVGNSWFASRNDSRVLQTSGPARIDNLQLFLESTSALTIDGVPEDGLASGTMIVREAAFNAGNPINNLRTAINRAILIDDSGRFTSEMKDQILHLRSGTDFEQGAYTIKTVISAKRIELDRPCRTTASGPADGVALVLMPIQWNDLSTVDSEGKVLRSASTFTKDMIGCEIQINSGTHFNSGIYEIVSIETGGDARLNRSCTTGGGAGAGGAGELLSQIQAPCRLNVSNSRLPRPTLKLVDDTHWINAVTVGLGASADRNLVCLSSEMHVVEAGRKPLELPGIEVFAKPAILFADGILRLALGRVDETDLPLDLNLETGAVRKVPRQDAETVQVVHRAGLGTRLRYAIAEEAFLPFPTNPLEEVPLLTNRQWALRPIVNDGNRVQLLTEDLWLKPAAPAVAGGFFFSATELQNSDFNGLDGGTVSQTLLGWFALYDAPLSENPAVTPIKLGAEWRITSAGRRYSARKDGVNLNVFRLESLSTESLLNLFRPRDVQSFELRVIRLMNSYTVSVNGTDVTILAAEATASGIQGKLKVALPDATVEVGGGPLQVAPVHITVYSKSPGVTITATAPAKIVEVKLDVLKAVENKTVPDSGAKSTTDELLRDLLSKKGAAGVALLRRLDGGGVSHLRFVPSPFFDHAGSESEADRLQQAFGRTQVDALATTAAAADDQPTLDFRALRPEEARRILHIEMSRRYLPGEPGQEPFRTSPCTPLRRLQFRRALPRDGENNPIPDQFASDEHPAVRVLEATAFRQMKNLSFLPQSERRSVEGLADTGVDGVIDPRDIDHLFLPRTFEIRYALDKPGAVFHQLIQARVSRLEQDQFQLTLEPATDVACREPQHVRIRDCVTAKVILHEDVCVQKLSIRGTPAAGTFRLLCRGLPATPDISVNASRSQIETALRAATGLPVEQLVVTGGPLPLTDVNIVLVGVERQLLVVDNSGMTGVGKAFVEFVEDIALQELRIIGIPAAGSQFEISYNSGAPVRVDFDETNVGLTAKLQTAAGLSTDEVVVVTGGPLPEKPVSIVLVAPGRIPLVVDNTPMTGAEAAVTMRSDQLDFRQLSTLDFARLEFTWDEVLGEVDIVQGVNELQALSIEMQNPTEEFNLKHRSEDRDFPPTAANSEIQEWLDVTTDHSIVVSGGPLPRRPLFFEYVAHRAGAIANTQRLTATSTGASNNTVELKQLRRGESGRNLEYVGAGLRVTDTPLQLLVQFNQDLFDIIPADQSVPAYKLEKNEGSENKTPVVLPAKTFLVSRVPDLHKPVVVADPVMDIIDLDNTGGGPIKIQLFPAGQGNITSDDVIHVNNDRHGFAVGDIASLLWSDKKRVGVKVTSVTGNDVTFTGGNGPELTTGITGVKIFKVVDEKLIPQSGDVVEITNVDAPLFNRDQWRLVRTPDFATDYWVYLRRDSEPTGRMQATDATWDDGTDTRVIKKATNESPMVIEWLPTDQPVSLTDEATLTFDINKLPISNPSNSLIFHPLILDNTHFAVTVEVQGTGTGSITNFGTWQRIRSRVRPYVQASPARKDRLLLPDGELPVQIQNEQRSLQHGDYIRISKIDEDAAQHLVGDWCLLEVTKLGALNTTAADAPKIVLDAGHGISDGEYRLDLRWDGGRLNDVLVKVVGNDASLPHILLDQQLPDDGTTMLVPLPAGDLSLFRPSFANGPDVGANGKVKKEGGAVLDIDTVTNESPMVVITNTDHGLRDRDKVEIYGCVGNTAANGDRWFVRRIDAQSFEIYLRSYAGNHANPIEVSYLRVNSFGKAETDTHIPAVDVRPFTTRKIDDLTIWTLRGDFDPSREFDWQSDKDRPLLQFTWAGRTQFISPNKLAVRGSFADVYSEPKQIKFLNPCLLSPKLAAVAIVPQTAPAEDKLFAMQRTLLFGDSAPVTKGQGEIVFEGPRTIFRFVVKDNRESVEFGLPSLDKAPPMQNADLYLVKYLITGAVVFDEIKQIKLESPA